MLSDRITAWIIGVSLLGLALVFLFRVGSSSVSAAPVAPHVVFGQARTQDGTVLDSGLAIEARINNINYGQSIVAGIASQSVFTHSGARPGKQLKKRSPTEQIEIGGIEMVRVGISQTGSPVSLPPFIEPVQ